MSCSNLYYDTTETYVNKEEAISMINKLKEGTLVIQLPCEKRKLEILEKKANNESDPQKKARYLEEFGNYKLYLNFIQSAIVKAATKHYTFSKLFFLPDTSVVAFKNGQRENTLINDSFEFVNNYKFEESELILLLRGQRYYDYLYIHNLDGSYPPDPFPYYSAMSVFLNAPNDYDKLDRKKQIESEKLLYQAFANLNYKLTGFYDKYKYAQ